MGPLYSLEIEALYRSESNNLLPKKNEMRLTQPAPDGWDSARFLEIVLSFASFPFPSFFLLSRR